MASMSPRLRPGAERSPSRRFWSRSSSASSLSVPSPAKDGLVFVNTRGNTPHLSSFTSQTWKKARERIGRPDLRWHDLRHTWVTMKIEAGPHPKEIQEEAGHSSYNTTMNIYGHLFESRGEKTADAMEEMYQAALKAPAASKVIRIA